MMNLAALSDRQRIVLLAALSEMLSSALAAAVVARETANLQEQAVEIARQALDDFVVAIAQHEEWRA